MRTDGRNKSELRPFKITPEVIRYAEGSVKVEVGNTHLLCTASVDDGIPGWLKGTGQGWISAEYGMLPRSTHTRIKREKAMSSGRSQEISRLIGRSLRAAVNMEALGERQIYVDCDVIQADGGTRTAAISGGFVALALALKFLQDQKMLKAWPLKTYVAAVSVGMNKDDVLLDLNYDEDSSIDTDMNFVMTGKREFIEIQGTAEKSSFSRIHLNEMLNVAEIGCSQILKAQSEILADFFPLEL